MFSGHQPSPIGIVYDTDAKVEPGVKIVGAFPDILTIQSFIRLMATDQARCVQYLSFLRSQTAKSVFESYGFNFFVKPTS
jgi:molybdate transport system substrate-binding protein